jgi:putative DNA primase/helicase
MNIEIERIRGAMQFVPIGGHDERVRMAFMLKSELGNSGRSLWDEWRDGRGDDEASSVWRSVKENGTLRIASLYHEAKSNGWNDDGQYQKPTVEELTERTLAAKARAEKEEAEIANEREKTAAMAMTIWKAASQVCDGHPYLLRKQVSPVATLREIDINIAAEILGYVPKSNGESLIGRLLVVPVKQGQRLSTLELIDGGKRKAALAGRGTKIGGYWATDALPKGEGKGVTILIGEGVATVLSAKEAVGHFAVAVLSSGNLATVAHEMRERYPLAVLVILADLVKSTGKPDPHAIKAALDVSGGLAVPVFGVNRDMNMTDFNDMALLRGKDEVALIIAQAKVELEEVMSWPEPKSLTTKVEPEPYPLDMLPASIRAAVEEVASFVKAPAPMIASSALAALSLAIQANVDVERATKLHGPVGLYLLTIADSGERKSTCDGFFTKAIRDYEEAQLEAAKPALKDCQAKIEAWEAKRAGVKEKIRNLAKSNKPTTDMEAALLNLEYEKPEQLRVPRLLYSDATPEALTYGLANKWPSGGVVSAEAGIVFGSHGMGKDSVMRNLATLNQLWDGTSLTIDRRSTESYTVRGARLTVALQVQEPTLREFFSKNGALARGTGFLARFLVAWPESTQGMRPFTEAPENWPHLDEFNRRIASILNQPAEIDDEGALTPIMLPLSSEAKKSWREYHDDIESELVSDGEFYSVRDVASKSADNAARLAALFQVFEHGVGAIRLDCFESASFITAWHLNEARRFYGELALPEVLLDAAKLDGWLINKCACEQVDIISQRVAQRLGPIRDKKKLMAALQELEALDRVRVVKNGRGVDINLNPSLLVCAA